MGIRTFFYRAKPQYVGKSWLMHTFFPTHCPFCGEAIHRHEQCCHYCLDELSDLVCKIQMTDPPPYISRVESMYYYDGAIREAISRLKFYSDSDVGLVLGETIGRMVISRYHAVQFDAIVPVPMSRKSWKERCYNQSQWLANQVSRLTTVPVWDDVLVKVRNTKHQHKQQIERRQANLKGAFAVVKPEAVKGRVFLLVDDVYTSGWTASYCAEALIHAGAIGVYVATVARAVPKRLRIKAQQQTLKQSGKN